MSPTISKLSLRLGFACLFLALTTYSPNQLVAQQPLPTGAAPAIPPTNADLTAWNDAVRKGDAAKVKELLTAHPSLVRQPLSFGKGALHIAADNGHDAVVAVLIEAKADLNAPGDRQHSSGSRETALHIAARHRHVDIVRRLIEAGADVNARQASFNTPLHEALRPSRYFGNEAIHARGTNLTRQIETVRLLSRSGADLFALNREGGSPTSPIQLASTPGYELWLDVLLTNARPRTVRDTNGRSLLDIARRHERWESLLTLALPEPPAATGQTNMLNPLQRLVLTSPPGIRMPDGARLEPRRFWELAAAGHQPDLFTHIGLDDISAVKAWVRDNPDRLASARDPEGRSPLNWALTKGFTEMVELLIANGADAISMDASGRPPLLLAIESGDLFALQKMKTAATRAGREEVLPLSPIEFALLKGKVEASRWLLELHPNVQRPCLTGGTLLHPAVQKAPAIIVQKLLSLGVDPRIRDHRKRTPLHLAVPLGSELMVDALLTAGAPLDAADNEGRLPLHEAARLGHAKLIAKLLPNNELIHQPDKTGHTAFELAVLGGHMDAVEILLGQRPDLQRRGPDGTAILQLAIRSSRTELVTRLLAAGADVATTDDRRRTPLHTAAERGDTNAVVQLLKARAPVTALDRDGKSALALALNTGHTNAARILLGPLAWQPDPAARVTTPLHLAAAAGNLDMTMELLANSPTPDLLDERGQTPLVLASMSNRWALIGPLVARGANVNATNSAGQSSLLMAQAGGDFTTVIALLRLGADLHQGDTNGNTPLHLAFRTGISESAASAWLGAFQHLEQSNLVSAGTSFSSWLRKTNTLSSIEQRISTVRMSGGHFDSYTPAADRVWQEPWKFVLAVGADAKVTNRLGQTALHTMAVRDYFWEGTHPSRIEVAISEMVSRGADPNAQDVMGCTAMHEAALRGRWQIVLSLLKHGGDPNLRTHTGLAAAHIALQSPSPYHGLGHVFQVLATNGADLNVRDTNGQTVLHHFSRFGPGDPDSHTGPAITEWLKAKPDLNAQDNQGDTPLHLALRAGRPGLASQLNSEGANPILKNKAGESAMELAAKWTGRPHTKPKLMPLGAKASPHAAATSGDLESLKVWFAYDPDSVVQSNTAANPLLNDAASNRHTNVVDYLLSKGVPLTPFVALNTGRQAELARILRADPQSARTQWRHAMRTVSFTNGNSWGTSSYLPPLAPLLHHAVALTNEAAVTLVLANSPDVNAVDGDGYSALYHASTNQSATITARLREAGAAENVIDLIALDRPQALKKLLSSTPAVSADSSIARPSRMLSPLALAVQKTNLAAVKLLLAAGADPNTPWPSTNRPMRRSGGDSMASVLHAAVAMEQVEIVRALLDRSTNVKLFEPDGLTALHIAAWRGHTGLLKLLIERGADPNAQLPASADEMRLPAPFRPLGHTPLHAAVESGQTNSISFLVRAGADVGRMNHFGQTPLSLLLSTHRDGMGMLVGSRAHPGYGQFRSQFLQVLPPVHGSQDEIADLLRNLRAK